MVYGKVSEILGWKMVFLDCKLIRNKTIILSVIRGHMCNVEVINGVTYIPIDFITKI